MDRFAAMRVFIAVADAGSLSAARQAAAPLAEGSLRLILKAYEADALPVHILHREDRLPQSKLQSFIAFAAPRLRAELGGRPSRSS